MRAHALRRTGVGLLAALLGLLATTPAFAHGGQYRGPGGRNPGDPTAPVKPPTSPTTWESWWMANAWKYLNLRERLRERDRRMAEGSGGGIGVTAGTNNANETGGEVQVDPRTMHRAEILPVVTRALTDADSEVRSAATIALGKMGFPRSLLDLRKARHDNMRDVRDGAVLGLGMLQDELAVEELRSILFNPKEQERTRSFAAISLGFIGGSEATSVLISFLDPAADAERVGGIRRTSYSEASALIALGMCGDEEALPVLRKAYASGKRFQPAVRSFASIALARLGDRESLPFILQGLTHQREPMRQSAAIALGLLANPDDEDVIKALGKAVYGDGDLNTRQFSIMSLSQIGGEVPRDILRDIVSKGSKLEVPFASLGLALMDDRDALPLLRKLFNDERDPVMKGSLALSLGLFGDKESAPGIRKMAFSQVDRGLRGHCLTALGLMKDLESAKDVRAMLEEERQPRLRLAAAVCLGLMQDPSTLPLLVDIAKNGTNVAIRASSCQVLGSIGNMSSARVLIDLVEDEKEKSVVRMVAVGGLGTLADRSLIPLLAQVTLDSNYAVFIDPLVEVTTIM
ncbi:MAG: HEAT repeat domain-containing protein [Planctomycetota bacterium]|jgi:HEAT repeat protein